jgi:hypothetical protein
MSRQYVQSELGDVVVGWDEPFGTFYGQLFKPGDSSETDSPLRAVGYHPDEQAVDPAVPYDPQFPVVTTDDLVDAMRTWGLSEATLTGVVSALEGP